MSRLNAILGLSEKDIGRLATHSEEHQKKPHTPREMHRDAVILGPWNVRYTAHAGSMNRAEKLKRVPVWLTDEDIEKIKSIYREALKVTHETGKVHHVDHIIPLQGDIVSGLHVPDNLQVITAKENFVKNNRHKA